MEDSRGGAPDPRVITAAILRLLADSRPNLWEAAATAHPLPARATRAVIHHPRAAAIHPLPVGATRHPLVEVTAHLQAAREATTRHPVEVTIPHQAEATTRHPVGAITHPLHLPVAARAAPA